MVEFSVVNELIEYPWTKSYICLMRSTYLEELIEDTSLNFSNNEKYDRFIRQNWSKISELTLLDPFRLAVLLESLDKVKDLEGDIVECGCYKGGSGILLGLWLKHNNIDKKIHLFDSFEGLPEPDKQYDKGYKKGRFLSDLSKIKIEIAKNGLTDYIELHQGWFIDTVPEFSNTVKTVLLHVDCDLYTSTNDCLPYLYPTVCDNGVILFDDLNDGGRGEKKAVLEYLIAENTTEIIHLGPSSQAYIIKNTFDEESQIVIDEQVYSFKKISENKSYLNWLKHNFDIDLIKSIKNKI